MARITCVCDPRTHKMCALHETLKEKSGCTLSYSDCALDHPEGHDIANPCPRGASCNCYYHIREKAEGLSGVTVTDVRPVIKRQVSTHATGVIIVGLPNNYCQIRLRDAELIGDLIVTIHECKLHWVIVTWIS